MRKRSLRTPNADRGTPQTPVDAGLPATPDRVRLPTEHGSSASTALDSGLEPTESVTRRVDADPVTALRYQEFGALPLTHVATVSTGDAGPRVIATLANDSGETWAYRVPKGPAPFAGGRATLGDAEVRLAPDEEPAPLTDGVLHPGESIHSAVSASALTGAEPGWPEGEYRFQQPLTVWTDERAHSYNWRVTLRV
ncbi:hypothetical protein JCM30237_27300 [Halolamina litorea]|uniref:Uncharacterized protein n=1 Tax=Halolamina litorea TaxID=1515593 RepID=A0ABD6BN14_9EURY|nr:hypothetical protein [Halolamina litorea]